MIQVNNWPNIIQNFLLPSRCIFCDQPGFAELDLCKACLDDFPTNQNCCYRCGEHFDTAINNPQLCGRCLKNHPGFDETHAPYLYGDNMRYLITQLKFHQQYKNARLLGTLMAKHMAKNVELPECLIPIPLHPTRYQQRGFNQSVEIARQLSTQLSIPMNINSCIRHRDTPHQTDLPAKQRKKNMRKAFTVVHRLPYQHVAIVDDVMTTGATTSALAEILKTQGVCRVDAWVCARA